MLAPKLAPLLSRIECKHRCFWRLVLLLAITVSCPKGFYTVTSSNAQSNGFSGKGSSDFRFTLATAPQAVLTTLFLERQSMCWEELRMCIPLAMRPQASLYTSFLSSRTNVHTSCTSLSEPFCPRVHAFASLSAWNASSTFHPHHFD